MSSQFYVKTMFRDVTVTESLEFGKIPFTKASSKQLIYSQSSAAPLDRSSTSKTILSNKVQLGYSGSLWQDLMAKIPLLDSFSQMASVQTKCSVTSQESLIPLFKRECSLKETFLNA